MRAEDLLKDSRSTSFIDGLGHLGLPSLRPLASSLQPKDLFIFPEGTQGVSSLPSTSDPPLPPTVTNSDVTLTDDTTLIAESEDELKGLLIKVKEENEKVDLKLNIQKTKIMASGPITSWEIDGETVETVADYILGGLQNHCRW